MSYKFDGSGDEIYANFGATKGALSTTYNFPITVGFFAKVVSLPNSAQYPIHLASSNGSFNAAAAVSFFDTLSTDQFVATSVSTGGSVASSIYADNTRTEFDTSTVGTTYNASSGWFGVVAVFNGTGTTITSRQIHVGAYSKSDGSPDTSSVDIGTAIGYFFSGETATGSGDFGQADPNQHKLAEYALWNAALSQSEIEAFLGGTAANVARSTNLIGYWPLQTGLGQAEGSDSAGTLVAAGAVLDSSDNPTISAGTALYLKLLAHSSAASATGVEGWVVDADNTTYYGKFTGEQFDAGTGGDSGFAVLKVALSEFGGTALTTSDTPQVVVRNTGFGTTMCDATVIEE